MNHSEVKYLHADASQSIASSPTFDNPQTCAKTPVKTPTVVRPRLEYIDFLSKYTRAPHNAAKVLSYLIFHAQRNKPGNNPARLEVIREGGRWGDRGYWWVQTRKDIASACELTEDQFRSAMAALERAGVAVHQRGRYYGRIQKYYGKTIDHFRLGVCARGNGLDCWPTVDQLFQMRIILGGDKPPLSSGDKPPALVQDALEVGDSLEGNIKDGVAGNATPESTPEIPQTKSGKVQDQKKPQASEPVLDLCLSQKLEFLKLNQNADCHPGNLCAELTAADRDIAQRLEYRLTQVGIDPLAFLTWLTPIRFQRLTLDLDLSIDYALLWMGKTDHQTYLMDAYRTYLAEQGKFSSSQQIKLCAMAPAGKKPPLLPLYEQDLDIAVGLFSWDRHWLDHQENGKWGGRTRLEHLRKYSRFTPEMETWITSEAIRERVLDLLGVHDAAAA